MSKECSSGFGTPDYGENELELFDFGHGWLQELNLVQLLLDVNRTRDKIAQAYTHTQRHMNNAWSEMVSCSSCFACCCSSSFLWFLQTIWDSSYPSLDLHISHILTFLMPLSLHFYILTTSNLMLYLLQLLRAP